jgi:hypothetical protein
VACQPGKREIDSWQMLGLGNTGRKDAEPAPQGVLPSMPNPLFIDRSPAAQIIIISFLSQRIS